jgi:hypothetical protein
VVQHGDGSTVPDTFVTELEALGFQSTGISRRGRTWSLAYNRFLRFSLHEYPPPAGQGGSVRLLLSWSFAWGEFVLDRGWQLSVTDESTAELYPSGDVIVAADAEAVRGEVLRVLTTLRLDLGAPDL